MGTIVNVCGLQRSGTTMLHLMLATGPDAVACGEVAGWYRVARYRGADLPAAFKPLQEYEARSFHQQALNHFEVDFIIDASKGIDWVIDTTRWSSQQNLKCFNILIWKDPVDLAFSKWKRGKFNSWRSHYLRYHERLFKAKVDFISVSYSDLIDNPSAKLELICSHIGMPYFEGKEKFWTEEHQFTASSEGVRQQVRSGQSRFEKANFPPEFDPLAEEVRNAVDRDPRLQDILRTLTEAEVSNLPVPDDPASHRYRATGTRHFQNLLWRAIKLPLLRLRWNILEKYVLRPLRGKGKTFS